jgi:hypothetical protein
MTDDPLRSLLTPLQDVAPVARPSGAKRRRHMPVLALAVALIFAVGSAATYGVYETTRSATAPVVASHLPRWMACLVGERADQAQAPITRRGYAISWRFDSYQSPTSGYTSTPKSVAKGSVVEDLILEGKTAIVFVRAPDDANAPPIASPCHG